MDIATAKKDKQRCTHIKKELRKWIDDTYKPNYMLTVQLPENWKSKNLFHSIDHLCRIMQDFERALLKRHWNKKHLPFIVFAEHGSSEEWHFHILLNSQTFTEQELDNAILSVGLPAYCLFLTK